MWIGIRKTIKVGIILTVFFVAKGELIAKGMKLEECYQIAESEYFPLKIAEEEVKLARLKLREARRNLMPSLSGKVEETKGKADRESGIPDFKEEVYGIELGQVIYHGGKLNSLFKQAKINLEIAQKKQLKCRLDLVYGLEKVYTNAVKTKLNAMEEKKLLSVTNRMLSLVEKQYHAGLVTKLELLNVQSRKNKIYYQMVSTQKDVSLALLELRQLMNLKENIPLEIFSKLKFKKSEINLDECFAWAFENRVEIFLAQLNLEYAKHEEKIAKSGGRLKVDFTGFYGKSGSAYKNEEFKFEEDWSVGLKLSKALGANTMSGTYNEGKTSPKLGQSSRTDSKTGTASLSLLDNLSLGAKKQEAVVSFLKATSKLREAEKALSFEVKKSYFNYQKALLQVEAALKEIEFCREEVKILKGKNKLNLIAISEVINGQMRLTEGKIAHNDALSFYHLSLADLNKSMGIKKF